MRYIIQYNGFTSIVEAEDILAAKNRVANDFLLIEKGLKLPKREILFQIVAREATETDEIWYNRMIERY